MIWCNNLIWSGNGLASLGRVGRGAGFGGPEKDAIGRKPPAGDVPSGAEKAGLYDGLVAYAGTWSIDGDKVSHHVDISWNQAWTGTTQVRQFRIDGDRLYIRSMPAKSFLNGRVNVAALEWRKIPAQ